MATEDFAFQEEPFLYPVYSPQSETPNIDFVFVHGLNPFGHKDHAFRTWTHVNNTSKTLWPQQFLPQDFPKARIWIFGYNSNVSKGVSEASISDHANSLLDALQWKRQKSQEHSRIRIIFLGHSLGGLVIKQALLNAKENDRFKPTWEAAFGLVFFGTPHRGGNTGAAAALAARVAKLYANDSADNNLLMCLKPDSLFTQESSERFSEQLGRYSILTFFETIPMKFHGINKVVVNRQSAILNVPREKRVALNRDHREICKFADRGSAYDIIRVNLDLLVAEALGLVGKSSSSSDTPRTSTPTLVNMIEQTGNRTSSFEKDEELPATAQYLRGSHHAVLSPSNSGETAKHEVPLEPRRGLHPESQNVVARSASTIASSHSNPQMTGQESATRDNYTSSSKYYISSASVSKLNDRFLQAVREIDTPIIHNWIKDPIRRPKLNSQHVHTALLGLAGFQEGKDPRFRIHAVSVILDECNPDLECRDDVYKATPLILAACGGREAIVLLLINKGASLKATDNKYERTALTWAARSNEFVTAEILLKALERNQDRQTIQSPDKDGLTALDFASQRKYERITKLLKSHGAA